MKTYQTLIIAAVSILAISCKKDTPSATNNSNVTNLPSFSGYTATDANGVPMGLTDSTDWTHDSAWISSEEDLFPEFQSLISDFGHYTDVQIFPAYPNPTGAATYFQFLKEPDVRFSFKLVDKNFAVIESADSLYANTFGVNTTSLASPTDTMIRMYYLFERNDSCLYKGHGDLRIN